MITSNIGLSRHSSITAPSAAVQAMLDKLDETHPLNAGEQVDKTFRYRVPAMHVDILRNGIPLIFWSAPTRWLNARGVSFLGNRYVRPDLDCRVTLISLYGTWDTIPGAVARCTKVDASTFEIEVRFPRTIDTALFVADAIRWKGLLVEDDALTGRLISRSLEHSNISAEHVSDCQAALEKIAQESYDLVLIDYELPQSSGAELATRIRQQGYPGILIGISAFNSQEVREACMAAGCSAFLPKPIGQCEITTLLNTLRNEPIYSSLTFSEDELPLLIEFVENVPKDAMKFQQAFEQGDAANFEGELRVLCSRSSAFGFGVINQAAALLNQSLKEGVPLSGLRAKVSELVRLCHRARIAGNGTASGCPC